MLESWIRAAMLGYATYRITKGLLWCSDWVSVKLQARADTLYQEQQYQGLDPDPVPSWRETLAKIRALPEHGSSSMKLWLIILGCALAFGVVSAVLTPSDMEKPTKEADLKNLMRIVTLENGVRCIIYRPSGPSPISCDWSQAK